MAEPDAGTPARRPRDPLPFGLRLAAIGFVAFMVLELLVYEKGIGRALWISALAGVLIFAVGIWFARVTARADASGASRS